MMWSSRRSDATVPAAGATQAAASGAAVDGYLCFSAQDWWYFNRGHSDFQLMTRIARHRPVLLVNSLGMRMPTATNSADPLARIRRKLASARRGLCAPIEQLPNFHVFTPIFLPTYGDGRLARANAALVRAQVRRAARRVGLGRTAVVVTLPTAWPIAKRLDRVRTVAYRSDRYSSLPEADGAQVAAFERDLLAAADVALFASGALFDEEAQLTARPALLRHGIDLDQFAPASLLCEHDRLAAIAHPRIGYVGMIDDYTVDRSLLEQVARSLPGAQLVLAGPVESDLGSLLRLPNVHHVGTLPFAEVPSFLAGLDVALMPWQDNEWIRHCNPIKLKEYLAVGVPVVSTDFPEVRGFADVIAVATDASDFVAKVGEALAGDPVADPMSRRAAVSGESWDQQAARLMALTERLQPTDEENERACAVS